MAQIRGFCRDRTTWRRTDPPDVGIFRQLVGVLLVGKGVPRESDNSKPDAVVVVLRRATIRMAGRRDRGLAMIRRAIAGMALMMAASGQAATGEREFAEQVIERMRAGGSTLDLRVSERDPLIIEMTYDGAEESDDFDLYTFYKVCAEASAGTATGSSTAWCRWRRRCRPPSMPRICAWSCASATISIASPRGDRCRGRSATTCSLCWPSPAPT
jgi:hypothetical protein